MELFGKSFNGTWKRHQRRKGYRRLETSKKATRVVRLGGNSPPRKFWKIKVIPKLRLRNVILSPLTLLRKLKNSYLNLMVNLAGNVGSLNTNNIFGSKRIPKARNSASKVVYSSEEVENRLVYEIYKALVIIQSKELQQAHV